MSAERDLAITEERIAATQASELQHLVDQLQLQISELAEQRDLERRRADRTETARQQLDARLNEALETAKSEREGWTEYVTSVENRALSDVDRARQEMKDLEVQQSKASEQHRALEKQLRQDIQAAQSAAATASQSADILRGRCDALDGNFQGFEICQLSWKWRSSDPKEFASLLMLGRNASGRSSDRLAANEYASVWTFNYCEDGNLLLKTHQRRVAWIAHNVYYVIPRTLRPVPRLTPVDEAPDDQEVPPAAFEDAAHPTSAAIRATPQSQQRPWREPCPIHRDASHKSSS